MSGKSITSRENPLYKKLKHLAGSSQARRKAGRTLLEGVHLCQAYLQHIGVPPVCVVSEGCVSHVEVAPLLAHCLSGQGQCIILPDALYGALSQVEQGVGLLFVIPTPALLPPSPLQSGAVLLDQLQDPGNLGSILRSAAAAGITQIFCSPDTTFAWSPKVLRAAMGAHFLLQIRENVDLAALIEQAQIPVIATSSHVPTSLYALDLTKPVAWIFGHEGQGVDPLLLARATHNVTIPQIGQIESMNVAASAAVCFFEQVRQLQR